MELSEIASRFFEPFLSPESRTFWPGISLTIILMLVFQAKRTQNIVSSSSFWLDIQLFLGRQMLGFIFLWGSAVGTTWYLSTHSVLWLDAHLFVPNFSSISPLAINISYTLALFFVWDCSRYILHRMMHEIPLLWNFHQLHHSAEHLTPLTHYRIHPLESILYTIRGLISTTFVVTLFYWLFRSQIQGYTLLGVPAMGLILNTLVGNIRHSEFWLPYPAFVERWFISPAQHQVHHSIAPEHYGKNYGTWLSIWDRLGGSLLLSTTQPTEFGIPKEERNHSDDIISAWFSPFSALLLKKKFITIFICLALPIPTPNAWGEEPPKGDDKEEEEEEDKEEEGDTIGNIFIYSADGKPREAGSAHVVEEEKLKRFVQNNVERLLEQVPGISTRSEDGFGLRPNIGIRGANSDRSAKVTLMEDGVLLAPAPYAAPAAYYFPMMGRITGMEIFKGAASTRHGPNTVGGALNLVSRSLPNTFQGHIGIGIGSFQTQNAHAWIGNRQLMIEGIHLQSDGFKELDNDMSTGFQRSELITKLKHQISKNQSVSLKLGYAREHSNETYLGLSQSDMEKTPYRRYAASELGDMSWSRTQGVLHWQHNSGTVHITADAYIHELNRAWMKFNRFSGGPDLHTLLINEPDGGQGSVYLDILRGIENSESDEQNVLIGTNNRFYQSKGIQGKISWSLYSQDFANTLEFGVRVHRDDVTRLHTEDSYAMLEGSLIRQEQDTYTLLHADTQASALAFYIHDDLSWKNVHIFPSTRIELIEGKYRTIENDWDEPTFRSIVLPGIGALYTFDESTDIFMGVHKGFSPVAPGQPQEVQSEESINYEAGIRVQEDETHAEIIGYFNDYQNITGQCTFSGGCTGDSIDIQFNGGRAWIYGLESIVRYRFALTPNLSFPLEGTYTLTQSSFQTGFSSNYPQFGNVTQGDKLPYVATHQTRVQAGSVYKDFSAFIGGTFRSKMLDEAGTFENDNGIIPNLMLFDISLQYAWSNTKATLAINNFLNKENISSWRPFGARPVAPRQIQLNIQVSQ